jgi:CPA2 family monovalent cation:H+ antiporter-2
MQGLLSVALAFAIGAFLDWPLARIVTIGFVISLSSTTVVLKLLQSDNELDSLHGQTALGILLVQDILIVPMLIILGYLGGETPTGTAIALQITGGVLIIGFLVYIVRGGVVKLPLARMIDKDHELQIFFSFLICFGLAALTGLMGLSTALGSFVAGILVSSAKATHWFHDSLHSLRVVFVALFFISIGMLIDLHFIIENIGLVTGIVFGVFLLNSLINIFVLRVFKYAWATSFYTGALLLQIGEFSFIIGATAFFTGIIADFAYQVIVSAISLSLLLSSFWVRFSHRLYERAIRRVEGLKL